MALVNGMRSQLSLRYYKMTPARIFLYFLWFIVVIELIHLFYSIYNILRYYYPESFELRKFLLDLVPEKYMKGGAWWPSVLYTIVSFYLYFYYYYKLLRKQAYRWIIQGLIFIYTGALVYSLYNIEQLMSPGAQLHTYMYVGVFSMLILGFMYFHSVLQSYNIIYFYRELPFWLSFGIVFYYLTLIPIFIFHKQLGIDALTFTSILVFSCVVYYSSFIIGFSMLKKGSINSE